MNFYMTFAYMSWDAFATLVTGLAAVGAAVYIGRRQSLIAARQTELIARQTELEAANIRAAMFDKRVAIYDASTAFMAEMLRTGKDPQGEILQRYLVAIDHARFLFNAEVSEELERIRKMSVDLWFLNEELHGEAPLPVGPERTQRARERGECFSRLKAEFENLPKTLGRHLSVERD